MQLLVKINAGSKANADEVLDVELFARFNTDQKVLFLDRLRQQLTERHT